MLKKTLRVLLALSFLCVIAPNLVGAISISNGQNASDLLGQYRDIEGTSVSYTKSAANNGPNQLGLSLPSGMAVDTTYHRLFLSDAVNNRVLVFNLDGSNELIDHAPDYVLGQPDFNTNIAATTQSGMNAPRGILFDSATNYLFVAENTSNRVLVFDISTITNGENAINVLGQADFTTATAANTQSSINVPRFLALDPSTNRLFVSELGGNRVKVFDITTITDGENAISVIGQADFTSTTAANSQIGLNAPYGLVFDSATNRLFVSELSANRVKVFDVATSTILATSTPASIVIGQADFISAVAANTQTGLNAPFGLAFDSSTNRLFVSESSGGNRIKVFNVATSTILATSTPAVNVLGQVDFTATGSANTQSGLSYAGSLAFNSTTNKLFISEQGGNRVKIFDVASITDGENAVDLIGQYSDVAGTVVSYTKSTANNGPSALGLASPLDVVVDTTNHRLFAADYGNNRVLVYNLNTSNVLVDKIPDNVLGQSDLYSKIATSTQSGLILPYALAYNSVTNMLFVAEHDNNRVKIFNVASITDGENAEYVLGQADFTGTTGANTQSGLNKPLGLAVDSVTNRLFVSEYSGNRLKVFDLSSGITNGMNASYVLGQSDFTGATAADSQSGLRTPTNIAFDRVSNRLFVGEGGASRVKVFNVATSTISNGMNASYVLGQADFTGATGANTQAGLNWIRGLTIDTTNNILYVAEQVGNRIKTFDIATSTITNGSNAINVLGQSSFTTTTAGNTQSGLNFPTGIYFDATTNFLYVAELSGNRLKIYNFSDPSLGGCSTQYIVEGNTTYTVSCGVRSVYSVTPSASVSTSGGGGGSTLSVTSTTTTTSSTTASTTTVYYLKPVAVIDIAPVFSFTRNLQQNSTGDDVRQLQIFLNTNGFPVALRGAGSRGYETSKFGPATRAALIRFQKANKIAPAVGYFGPITRAVIIQLIPTSN